MSCEKCGYRDKREVVKNKIPLCQICNFFSPDNEDNFMFYINEKIDWKILESFRRYGQKIGSKQKRGMEKKASEGKTMTRVALGYSLINGKLIENENASRVHSLFKNYLEREISLNKLSKEFKLSINGMKKVLTNRTYLGEIKFNGRIYKGNHNPIISPEIFYAVQRKLKESKNIRKIE